MVNESLPTFNEILARTDPKTVKRWNLEAEIRVRCMVQDHRLDAKSYFESTAYKNLITTNGGEPCQK